MELLLSPVHAAIYILGGFLLGVVALIGLAIALLIVLILLGILSDVAKTLLGIKIEEQKSRTCEPEAARILGEIMTDWDWQTFKSYAHPSLGNHFDLAKLERTFVFLKGLGPFRAIEYIEEEGIKELQDSVTIEYLAKAIFERSSAYIQLCLQREPDSTTLRIVAFSVILGTYGPFYEFYNEQTVS